MITPRLAHKDTLVPRSHRAAFFVAGPLLALLIAPSVQAAAPLSGTSTSKRGASVPFTTYEAEATNRGKGQVITMHSLPGKAESTPELEASGRGYVQLDARGDYVEFPRVRAANTIVVRHCIPDDPGGNGTTATLSLFVNRKFRQSLTLSSKHNWLYGKEGENGQANEPSAGQSHVFWDESRFFITGGGVRQGDTIRLQKDSTDTATFYRVDLIDLETAPEPLSPPPAGSFLSVVDYGANGTDTNDDTAAIKRCIDDAKAQKKLVWIPAGTYYQNEQFQLDGVTVRGAGMWHTNLIGTVEGTTFAGNVGFRLGGTNAKVSDLHLESAAHTKRSKGGVAILGSFGDCSNWTVENVWITHTLVGFWMSGVSDGTIRNCRVRFTYADGININRGSTNCLVENNHVRGSGDDGLAILAEIERTPTPSKDIKLRNNTVAATWWGHNCDLAGGSGHIIEDNVFADNAKFGCFTIALPGAYPMYATTDCIIRRNSILRGGGNYAGQKRGAVSIFPGSTSISNVLFQENEILMPIFRGIHLFGTHPQAITFERNLIDHPGEDGIFIDAQVMGSGEFRNNVVRGVNATFQSLNNQAGAGYNLTFSGNSR
jgi:hypothetical protein